MSSTSLLQVTGSEGQDGIISTPTRFLMECGEWNFTPSLSTFATEVNPFDYIGVQKTKENVTAAKQDPPPTPPTTKEYLPVKTTNVTDNGENISNTPPTPPQQNNNQRRTPNTSRVVVSSNSSLDSESSVTSSEQVTGMKALTKAVEIESQQLKKQRQLQEKQTMQQQPQPFTTTTTKNRSQRSQPHQFSFHSYQPSKPAQHASIPVSNNNTTLIIKQENGQPSTKSRRNKDKLGSSDISELGMDRKRRNSDDGEEAIERRRKFLERNRVAASKCRQKKKAWITELEQRSEKVIEDNKRLSDMVNQLKEEAMFLKNQLLAHGTCNCDVAKQYLKQSTQLSNVTSTTAQAPPSSQQQQMLPPPPPLSKQKPKSSSGEDYFAPVHSTLTPSLLPLRGTSPT